ncbi:MAG: NUDIX domain-containing protein [Candidatus Aenigmarchaeota archaeon]|nr:NUDIX domain-containing protein [Candidatus Aenigmarchaeota archaeon]
MGDEEIVDIVDENCNVLFSVPKSDAHEKGLLHRTVITEIKDSEGKWLLVRQASDKQDAGQFVSPVGGHVKSGETEEEALKREVLEEVGLSGFKFKYIGRTIFNRVVRGRKENHFFIMYETYSDSDVMLNHESVEWRKFTDEELRMELKNNPAMFGDAFHAVVKAFFPWLLN